MEEISIYRSSMEEISIYQSSMGEIHASHPSMGEIHASHPNHKLELRNYIKPYTCNGCKLPGVGPRHRCEVCDYDLHQYCMFYHSSIRHSFFTNSIFNFFFLPGYHHRSHERYCKGCGKPVKGFVYHCKENGWHLHPGCMNLPNMVDIGGVSLILRYEEMSKKCSECTHRRLEGSVSGIRGWSYVSRCKKYHLHVHCAMEKILEGCKDEALGFENLAIQLRPRKGGNGGKFTKIVKVLFKASVSLLTGDPISGFSAVTGATDLAQDMFSRNAR